MSRACQGSSEAKVKDQVKLGIRDIRDTYGHTLWAHTEPIPALSRSMLYRRGVGKVDTTSIRVGSCSPSVGGIP